MDCFDSAFEQFIKFEQWKIKQSKRWEERNNKSINDENNDEHFTSSLLKSVNPSGHKVIVCEPSFLVKTATSFPEKEKKLITEDPKYACIFEQ